MRIKKIILGLFLITAVAGVSIGVYGFKKQTKKRFKAQFKLEQYTSDWRATDSLINLGLTESALKVANDIYKKAKADRNSPQIIKAIMYRMRLNQEKEENVVQKSIDGLNEEIKQASYPEKPLLHSMLADLYAQYYNNNRWKFAQRSQAVNIKLDDIATWDLKTLFDQIIKQHQLALKNDELLKETTVELFDDVIYGGNTDGKAMRATLYDFIAHRALDFFMTGEADIIRPAYKFELNNEDYFSDAQKFIQLNISTEDTLSTKFYAITIFKNLIAFHVKDKNPSAVIDVELKRLLFLKNYGTTGINDSLYIKALIELEKKHSNDKASAVVSYEIANYYYSLSQKYDPRKSEQYKWEAKHATDICYAAIKKYPDSRGAINCTTLIANINTKNIAFTLEHANIPNQPYLGYLTFKNVKKIYARAVKTTSDKIFTSQYYYYDQSNETILKSLLSSKVEKEWTIDLPDDGDSQTHYTQIAIPELPEGIYAIVVSEHPKFVKEKNAIAFAVTQNTNIAYVQRRLNSESVLEFNVLNRLTGEPLKNVKATLYDFNYNNDKRKYQYKEQETYTTNEQGKFIVKAATNKSRSFNVRFTNNNDQYYTDGNFNVYDYGQREDYSHTTSIMFTDRNIYRPGQTIYFKGIVMFYKGKAVKITPNTSTTVYLRDANYQEVAKLDVTTNDYGTYSGSFILPMGVLTGQMTITDSYGSNAFSVEEYKRPKFEVLSNPIKGTYRLGDTIAVAGIAKAFSGARIDGAQVKYRVVRTASFPYWWWWRCGYYPSSPQMEIVNGTTLTNDTGAYTIKFKAIPDYSVDKKSGPTFNYQVYVDVTDINGETHSTEITALVAYTSLNINVATDEMINAKTAEPVTINCTNTNGVIENANIEISIHKLMQPQQILRKREWEKPDKFIIPRAEFNTRFPNDVYDDEDNKAIWAKDKKMFSKNFDTSKEKIIKADVFNNLPVGEYILEAFAKDKMGAEVKDIKYFTVYDDKQKTLPALTPNWFAVTKAIAEPGEKAAVLIGSSEKNVKVLFCTEEDGKLGTQEWITLNNEQKLIEIPIEEKHRGGLGYHFVFINKNRMYSHNGMITVPHTNKQLDISFETFRNKLLPGEKEEWRLKIKDKKGDKLNAEMLATLYDASLDQFKGPNAWYMDLYGYNNYSSLTWNSNAFQNTNAMLLPYNWNDYSYSYYTPSYDQLNWFGYYLGYMHYRYDYYESRSEESRADDFAKGSNDKPRARMASAPMTESKNKTSTTAEGISNGEMEKEMAPEAGPVNDKMQANIAKNKQGADLTQVKARTNFNETAFFYPHLQTDSSGSIIIKFTMPEALTKWRMMGLAHTKDLKVGHISNELITQKQLMVVPNAPRFFRENDKMELSSKITNLSDKDQEGQIQLYLYDAISLTDITSKVCGSSTQKIFTIKKGLSTAVDWGLSISEGYGAITYKVVAKAGNFSDGEEMTVPVLTNRMLVTETMPLNVRSNQTKTFNFEKFISQNNGSTTLRNHKLTLEFTANPAWYAIQALPYLMEYPYDCAEQTFSKYYANSIATHIANSTPKIKAVFESWKTQSPDALISNLEKNQELKSVLLQETPWVMDAKNESERKKRVGLLFDLNKMATQLSSSMRKLQKMQLSNGGWPWFEGGPDDRYITQHIATGIGHLQHLGIKQTDVENGMLQDAVRYLDDRIREDYEWLLKYKHNLNEDNINYNQIQYLYARSYFKEITVEKKNKVAFDYYKGQAQKYWLSKGRYMQGMIALCLSRFDDKITPAKIMRSIKENALVSEEMGMYWKENYEGYYWWHAPIETQALLIEAFDEVSNDKKAVDDLRVWLLKSKQTQDWKTTKATTEACYALLLRGTNWLSTETNVDITLGTTKINPKDLPGTKQEAGTGYFKTAWSGSDIKTEMGKVTVTKKDEGVSWGALYWQYFEQLDKITPAKTPLNIIKKLFVERNTASGPVIELIDAKTKLKVGDKVKVRIELRVDRDMQYVHMKDMRASGFEPINVLSEYKWQDHLGYYESTGDAATNFFFSYLNKGTYVFEYPLRVSHNGDFSNGITSIQCMYAPEFTSNSEGIRVKIEK